jgi:uncharacterized repeat protein (TIGR01451 family)
MQHSLRQLSQAVLYFLITFSFIANTGAQTCNDHRYGGVVGFVTGDAHFRNGEFSHTTPTDLVWTNGTLGVSSLTCRGCFPGDSHLPPMFAKGGSDSVSHYEKVMVIEFAEPVANLEWQVWGARTVTDNRGYTVHLDPMQAGIAKFPGGGITSITISDPIIYDVYYPNGTLDVPGYWEMISWNVDWTLGSTYQQCNCGRPQIPRPAPETAASTDWNNNGIPDWRMDVEVSDDDGLVLKNIRLENRYMAEEISVPYYVLQTNFNPPQRGELKPSSSDPTMTSRLVFYAIWNEADKLVVQAIYVIGNVPNGSSNCLEISQRYEFLKSIPGDQCEPSGTLPCARWRPMVSYKFVGAPTDFNFVSIAQRQHPTVDQNPYNSVGLFRDADTILGSALAAISGGFAAKCNPVPHEWSGEIVAVGKDAQSWDNIHQTYKGMIDEPSPIYDFDQGTWGFVNPGCPECIHSHWRWGQIIGGEGLGSLIGVDAGSNQDVDFGIALYRAGEEDPQDYHALINREPIRTWNPPGRDPLQIHWGRGPEAVVYWQSATGWQLQDNFFAYGAFFNPSIESHQVYTGGGNAPSKFGNSPTGDGISSIVAAQIYATGSTTINPFDATLGGPLPAGYAQYAGNSYEVTATAEASSPYTTTFSVPSVSDQALFDSLRVFHLEQDPFDPDGVIWVDRTILAPNPQQPDFAARTLNARTNSLGHFVVATLTQPQPPNTGVADIAVSTSAPASITEGNNITYTITVSNSGPQPATGTAFSNALSPNLNFVSVTPSQGECSEVEGTVVCKLGAIAASGSATISIVAKPTMRRSSLPPATTITNTASAKAQEADSNESNNSSITDTTLLPDGNTSPTITINTPAPDALFVGPATISISAAANDSDGSVSQVDFYGDGNLIGTVTTPSPPNQYNLVWNNVSFGPHSVAAVVTDNLNKTAISDSVRVIVNGTASVTITSPANYASFNRPANIAMTATASLTGGTISKVDFYDGFKLLGTGTLSGSNQYSLTWNGVPSGNHVITAVATDNSNVTTTSAPAKVTVNESPVISIAGPAQGTVFSIAPATITITANASDWDGYISRVDFYASGSLIGSNSTQGINQFNLSWNNVASGNYSLTAVAVDNAGASITSAPVTIRVNIPPTVSLTSPASGTQFTSPANITMTATAADSDGSVAGVDFYANGIRVGGGTPIGGGQFTFTWNAVGIGSYTLSARATDNNGGVGSSATAVVSVKTPVLFVTGSTSLNTSDTAVKTRLEALFSTVTVKDADSSTTADANGKSLVVISSTVTPTALGTKFRTVAVPVIIWESGSFNNMGMTGSTNKDFGTKTNQTQVTITNPSHPLAAGLSGNATVVTSGKTFDWGKPNANAISVATILGDATKTAIFAYESGAVMPGLTAPARRVALFLYDDTAASFNANGTALLDAAIRWARGGGSIAGSVTISPMGLVDLTTSGTLDWAHWGLNGPTAFDHKGGVTPLITNFTKIGSGAVGWFVDNETTFSWTDGFPTVTASNTGTGVNVNGVVGNGFEITVPVDTNLRTLKLYIGVWYAQAKMEASMSDGSAPTYTNTSFNNNGGGTFGLYTFNFKGGSPGQTIKIRFTILNQYFSPNGNVALKAATLEN